MSKGRILRDSNGEKFASICQITDVVETKVLLIQVSTDLNCTCAVGSKKKMVAGKSYYRHYDVSCGGK